MAFPAALTRRQLLRLYKHTLQAAVRFPSIKREEIIEEIRVEWRAGCDAADGAAIAHRIEVAIRGLETLQKYTSLNPGDRNWTVDLDKSPLGAGEASSAGEFTPFGAAEVKPLT